MTASEKIVYNAFLETVQEGYLALCNSYMLDDEIAQPPSFIDFIDTLTASEVLYFYSGRV